MKPGPCSQRHCVAKMDLKVSKVRVSILAHLATRLFFSHAAKEGHREKWVKKKVF